MADKHTPGPWVFEPCHTKEGTRYHHIRSGPTGVADTYHSDPITIMGYGPMAGHIPHRHSNPADAQLIAAAPELLAALVEQVAEFDKRMREYIECGDDAVAEIAMKHHGDRMDRSRAAIAKATGT